MAAKTEAKEAAPVPEKAPVAAGFAPASGPGLLAWVPAVLAVVFAPLVSWAVAETVLLPRLVMKLAASAESAARAEAATAGKHEGKERPPVPTYEFNNVVVNLAGTMGTRYLKTTFIVTSVDMKTDIKALFEGNKPRLTDITLNVLSSLTLADLEEPGAKNVLREKLVAAYNQALGRRVAEQVYFSDFVVQ
jgi:flagellar FliL protein